MPLLGRVLPVSMGGSCFSDEGGFIFKWEGVRLMGGIGFDGGGEVSKKIVGCPKRLCRRCLTRT